MFITDVNIMIKYLLIFDRIIPEIVPRLGHIDISNMTASIKCQ